MRKSYMTTARIEQYVYPAVAVDMNADEQHDGEPYIHGAGRSLELCDSTFSI